MLDDHKRSPLSSRLRYRDPIAALHWLEEAFGFEPFMVIRTKDGRFIHSETRRGDAVVIVTTETDETKSPATLGGVNTQSLHVGFAGDVDAHCARARKAGAEIVAEPKTQFYGDRTYIARDLEGHLWTFSQTINPLTRAEWDAAAGVVTTARP